jgi:hypothetical protein
MISKEPMFGRAAFLFLVISCLGPSLALCVPATLSETGMNQEGVRSYTPQYPLWSDGALKKRGIFLPPGKKIETENPDHWLFPVGTKIWKEFSFPIAGRLRKIETRYMEKISDEEWAFATYLWDESEKETKLASEDGVKSHIQISSAPPVSHDIPSVSDCLRCHKRGGDPVLGFEAIQLSAARDTEAVHFEISPPTDMNLRELIETGKLTHNAPEFKNGSPRIEASSPKARIAAGYLHANCATCHNSQGSSLHTRMDLRHRMTAKTESELPVFAETIGKRTKVFSFPGVPQTLRVDPGSPETSALYGMMVLEGASHMPPIGANIVDKKGIEAIREWILSLKKQ